MLKKTTKKADLNASFSLLERATLLLLKGDANETKNRIDRVGQWFTSAG